MRILGRVLFIVIAAGWVLGSPVTAQIKNPIEAAKEAFKKAREQQKPPQQPTPPAPAAPGIANAGDASSEALSKLASSVGFVDIVGVKLGMTIEQAVAALKAANPKLVIDIHDGELTAAGKVIKTPRVILAHLPAAARNPAAWGNLDGSHEAIGVQLTTPPGPIVVETVLRYVSFPSSAPVAASTVIDAHRKKYGPESTDHASSTALGWIFDSTGRLLRNPTSEQIKCPGVSGAQIKSGDIRGGNGLNEPGKTIPGLEILASNRATDFDRFPVRCVPYVVVNAQILHGSPTQLVADFWTSIHSIGLEHNSLLLTAAFVKQANEDLIKQQEDAGAKRAAPKL